MASAGYSGTPLPRKLGIQDGSVVVLVNAPEGIEAVLGKLPPGARLKRGGRGARDLTWWFVRSRARLAKDAPRMVAAAEPGRLWISWPKKSSGVATDVTEDTLREVVLPTGWVDIKVCAIDATWSGLLFARRRG